jgi:hypothetical protein
MPSTHLPARGHLERAVAILEGTDSRSRQLRYIIERTISLMDDLVPPQPKPHNVVDFVSFRARVYDLD